jgi:hypothetical protein
MTKKRKTPSSISQTNQPVQVTLRSMKKKRRGMQEDWERLCDDVITITVDFLDWKDLVAVMRSGTVGIYWWRLSTVFLQVTKRYGAMPSMDHILSTASDEEFHLWKVFMARKANYITHDFLGTGVVTNDIVDIFLEQAKHFVVSKRIMCWLFDNWRLLRETGTTLFQLACEYNSLELAKWCIEKYEIKCFEPLKYYPNRMEIRINGCVDVFCGGKTLWTLCGSGFLDFAKWLWPLIETHNNPAWTVGIFRNTCSKGRVETLKWLVEINLTPTLPELQQIVFLCGVWCQIESIELLMSLFPLKFRNDDDDMVRIAIKNDHDELLTWLLDRDNVYIETHKEELMMCACFDNSMSCANVLWDMWGSEAFISETNIRKLIRLLLGCKFKTRVLLWLLHMEIVSMERYCEYLIEFSIFHGRLEILKVCHAHKPEYFDKYGTMILTQACSLGGKIEILKWIVSLNVVNIEEFKHVMFGIACHNGRLEVTKWMFDTFGPHDFIPDTDPYKYHSVAGFGVKPWLGGYIENYIRENKHN